MNEFIFEDLRKNESCLFSDFVTTIVCRDTSEVLHLFSLIEYWLQQGCFIVGYFSYELGNFFNLGVEYTDTILFHLSVFRSREVKKCEYSQISNIAIFNESYSLTKEKYLEYTRQIKHEILQGNVYQVNFTMQKYFQIKVNNSDLAISDSLTFYQYLKNSSSVRYAAYYKNEEEAIISLSPELFFARNNDTIIVRPMKGTIVRGRWLDEDLAMKHYLQNDPKNKAENGMIVDLLRNDLGRISVNGSVKVDSLFATEKYETLWQMVSQVNSKLKKDITWFEIFKSLFPSGSITGAPKISAMKLIREFENVIRGVYTGAIGYITPENNAVFNVAIRTIVVNESNASLGIGSGIVWDSIGEAEYDETILKATFLKQTNFQLIETMRLHNGKIRLLNHHIARMKGSAEYFIFKFDEIEVKHQLNQFIKLQPIGTFRIRLILFKNGKLQIESFPFIGDPVCLKGKIAVSSIRTDSIDLMFYHKTTNRELYEKEYNKGNSLGITDVIFLNEKGNLTEGCISNIFIKKDNQWVTPHWQSGLLRGIYREYLLKRYPLIQETFLTLGDLLTADKIFLCNSLRGIRRVELVQGTKL